jgi:hypothetical protein
MCSGCRKLQLRINAMPAVPGLYLDVNMADAGCLALMLMDVMDPDAARDAGRLAGMLRASPLLRSYLVNVVLRDEILNLVRTQLEGGE